MRLRKPKDVRAYLEQQPSLGELSSAFPVEWRAVQAELRSVLATNDFAKLRTYIEGVAQGGVGKAAPGAHDAQLSAEIRQHMALAAVRRMCVSAATGVTSGRIRFNLFNGYVAQKLLFAHDLERKPVSMLWFRALWPLLWQRSRLMVLVQPRGIYCFYSKQLVRRLADMIGDRACLEIAAGDGTLARFLAAEGVEVTATDDYSWKKSVRYPEAVLREDAAKALRHHKPEVVICSWPPAGNSFERHVFETPSVGLYIVISSRYDFGTGDWEAYRSQKGFSLREDPSLSRLVLPPEIDPAVYVFERNRTATATPAQG
jgi:hypothetical protein